MAAGRLSEIFSFETVQLDKYVRTLGIPRMAEKYMLEIEEDDLLILENYSAGINKLVEGIHVYPLEFYMFWQDFEPYTPKDSIAITYLL